MPTFASNKKILNERRTPSSIDDKLEWI